MITKIATITSKRQITIPAAIYRKVQLENKRRVLVSEENGRVILKPIDDLIENLAGSLKMPGKWKNKNLDQIIESSKKEYFNKKR